MGFGFQLTKQTKQNVADDDDDQEKVRNLDQYHEYTKKKRENTAVQQRLYDEECDDA